MERTSHFPGMLLVIFEEPFAKESRQHYLFSKYAIVPDYCDGQVSNLFFKGYTLTKEKVWEWYGKGWAISDPYVEMVWGGWVMIWN